ncbi:hypothetical protein DFH29DRAFT_1070435 [Suillus ampliporus]|nr:hypothetical protein DFH29DRAFT_1070435 [Suillus ampliporus]
MSKPQYANLVFYPHCHIVTEFSELFCGQFGHDTAKDALILLQTLSTGMAASRWWSAARHLTYPRSIGRPNQLFFKKAYDELLVKYSKTPAENMAAFITKTRKHAADVIEHAEQYAVVRTRTPATTFFIVARLIEAGYKPELDYAGIFWLEDQVRTWLREPKTLRNHGIVCAQFKSRRSILSGPVAWRIRST